MRSRRGSGRAMAAAARRAASGRRHPPRPTPPATRPTARRGGRVPSLGGRRARAPAASATRPPEWGSARWPSPRPRRRCASDQRRSSGTRRRRAGSHARYGRRRPRPPPHRPLSRDDHRRRHGFIACDCAALPRATARRPRATRSADTQPRFGCNLSRINWQRHPSQISRRITGSRCYTECRRDLCALGVSQPAGACVLVWRGGPPLPPAAGVRAYELCAAESRAGEFRVGGDRAGLVSQPLAPRRAEM